VVPAPCASSERVASPAGKDAGDRLRQLNALAVFRQRLAEAAQAGAGSTRLEEMRACRTDKRDKSRAF
jgi:hypothetical protein